MPSECNALGVGATQLYNTTVTYNHKRHGCFTLGYRKLDFRVKPKIPKKLSEAYLLVIPVDDLDRLAEHQSAVLQAGKRKAGGLDAKLLTQMVREQGRS